MGLVVFHEVICDQIRMLHGLSIILDDEQVTEEMVKLHFSLVLKQLARHSTTSQDYTAD